MPAAKGVRKINENVIDDKKSLKRSNEKIFANTNSAAIGIQKVTNSIFIVSFIQVGYSSNI